MQMTMMFTACLIPTALLLLGCAGRDLPAPTTSPAELTLYKRGDSRDTISCQLLLAPVICATSSGLVTPLYYDCSDAQFDCVFDTLNVMAVPK